METDRKRPQFIKTQITAQQIQFTLEQLNRWNYSWFSYFLL